MSAPAIASRAAAYPAPTTLGSLLRARGLAEPGTRAIRHSLHREDRSDDVPSLSELVSRDLLPAYERMQDGRRLGHGNLLLSFVAEPGSRARLLGLRRVFARRKGIVPGDIVYDYEAAPLLHAFIARARCPVFYDAVDEAGLEDLFGSLVVRWPAPAGANVRQADDPNLVVEKNATVLHVPSPL